jgi:hypothetical protein
VGLRKVQRDEEVPELEGLVVDRRILVGAAIVALPDSGERVFSLSRNHGPSPLDLLGVTVVVGSWLPVAVVLPSLWRAAGDVPARLSAGLALAGAAGLAITIAADLGRVWVIAASMLVAAQLIVIANGGRAGQQPTR